MTNPAQSSALSVRDRQRASGRSRPKDPAVEPVQPVAPDDLARRDLTVDPPPGLPRLTVRMAAFVQRRLLHPDETYEASKRASGMRSSGIPGKVALYLRSLAAWSPPGTEDLAGLRHEAVQRLLRVVRTGEDRDSVMAAKVLDGYLPPPAPQTVEDLRSQTDEEILRSLRSVLDELGRSDLLSALALSPAPPGGCEGLSLPAVGNDGELDDVRDPGPNEEQAGAGGENENPKTPVRSIP